MRLCRLLRAMFFSASQPSVPQRYGQELIKINSRETLEQNVKCSTENFLKEVREKFCLQRKKTKKKSKGLQAKEVQLCLGSTEKPRCEAKYGSLRETKGGY